MFVSELRFIRSHNVCVSADAGLTGETAPASFNSRLMSLCDCAILAVSVH